MRSWYRCWPPHYNLEMDLGGLFKPRDEKKPQNLTAEKPGAIPVFNQVTNAASGATHAFSGIGRQVNASLKKIGAKHIETGIGCGVGFGAGLALKPGVVHQFQLYLVQNVGKMMTKFGVSQSLGQPIFPTSMLSRTSTVKQNPPFDPKVFMMQYVGADNPIQRLLGNKNLSKSFSNESIQSQGSIKSQGSIQSQGVVANSSFSNRTEKVISRFVQNPALQESSWPNKIGSFVEGEDQSNRRLSYLSFSGDKGLQSENRILHMVMKHEQVIEELLEENERFRRILMQDLKISPDKFHSKHFSKSTPRGSDSFEARRKPRRR